MISNLKTKFNQGVENAINDMATLGDDGITELTRKFEQLTDDTKR